MLREMTDVATRFWKLEQERDELKHEFPQLIRLFSLHFHDISNGANCLQVLSILRKGSERMLWLVRRSWRRSWRPLKPSWRRRKALEERDKDIAANAAHENRIVARLKTASDTLAGE